MLSTLVGNDFSSAQYAIMENHNVRSNVIGGLYVPPEKIQKILLDSQILSFDSTEQLTKDFPSELSQNEFPAPLAHNTRPPAMPQTSPWYPMPH